MEGGGARRKQGGGRKQEAGRGKRLENVGGWRDAKGEREVATRKEQEVLNWREEDTDGVRSGEGERRMEIGGQEGGGWRRADGGRRR